MSDFMYISFQLEATSGSVNVVVSGTGTCLIQFNLDYNVKSEKTQNNYKFGVEVKDKDRNNVDIKLCGK